MRRLHILLVALALAVSACGAAYPDGVLDHEPPTMVAAQASVQADVPAPTDIAIPDVGVRSTLIELGLKPNRTVEVPEDAHVAGWYTGGPKPGQLGPAAIIGHVDSHSGAGVFSRLADLEPGQLIYVRRADDSVIGFRVDRVERYPKDEFPTDSVYGNTERPELRLITCGGEFDRSRRSYRDNVVVYATQVRRKA